MMKFPINMESHSKVHGSSHHQPGTLPFLHHLAPQKKPPPLSDMDMVYHGDNAEIAISVTQKFAMGNSESKKTQRNKTHYMHIYIIMYMYIYNRHICIHSYI